MESIIVVTRGEYGFGHNWSLVVTTKDGTRNFYLGQDVKFCERVLGMSPREVVNAIGDNDLGNPETLKKLGGFIIDQLELDEEKVGELENWELCAQ
jgi:hypothetical protein